MTVLASSPAPRRRANGAPGSARANTAYPLMSRADIESMIAKGRKVIIVDQHVLKVDAWLPYHPGGEKSILHMVGKDATDEVNCLHSADARKSMDRYRIGRIEGTWENFIPPVQGGMFREAPAYCEDTGVAGAAQEVLPGKDLPAAFSAVGSGSETSCSRAASPGLQLEGNVLATEATPHARKRRPRKRSESTTSFSSTLGSQDEDSAGTNAPGHADCSVPAPGLPAKPEAKPDVDQAATAFLDIKTREEIDLDLERYPSVDTATQQNVIKKYRELHDRIKEAGLYDCNFTAYAWEIARYMLLFALCLIFLRGRWYAASGLCLGAFWHQLVFTAHDAGHMGITHSFYGDTVIGIIIADFLGGLSICWWKDNHNVHHIVTNSPEHDPDIEHMPFFAVSHRLLLSLRSSYYDKVMEYDAAARFFLSIQHYTYYLVLCFGRFNLYRLSWTYIIMGLGPRKGPARWFRWLEAVGQVFFWVWFGYGMLYRSIDSNWGRFVFVMVSHVATMPLHVQITLSHFAMSTADLGPKESFPQRMLRTTMDVDCPRWLDFFHGGLQFQAIHHLYPRIPRHNLRKTQKLVQEFCNEVGIPYALYGFVDGNKEVIGRLADVSRQAKILAQCQQAIIDGKV